MLTLVVFIFRAGDPNLLTNYRPISLLNVISKLLEKLVHRRTLNILIHNNVLSDAQFGFKHNSCTEQGIHNFVDRIYFSMDTGKYYMDVFVDLSKAFDSLNRGLVLRKLHHYGPRGTILEWYRSYFSG